MWVAPTARGHGTGAALVEAVLAWAREIGAARVGLWVTTGNARAIALYDKTGFAPAEGTMSLPSHPCLGERRMVCELRGAR